MHGICNECGRGTDTEQYPYLFSLCSECWRSFKGLRVSRRVGGAHPVLGSEADGNHRCFERGQGGRGVGVGKKG